MWDDGVNSPQQRTWWVCPGHGWVCHVTLVLASSSFLFKKKMFGAWLDGPLRWRANNDFKGTHHFMPLLMCFLSIIKNTHCKNAS
jgi:hypothetical protein